MPWPPCSTRNPEHGQGLHMNGSTGSDVSLEARCRDLLCDLGLARADDPIDIMPLTGGVASDIARVVVAGQAYCVKFALEKLRVAEEWHVPVHRNRAEYDWLQFVSSIEPTAVPRLFGRSSGGFAMELVQGPDVRLWKDMLLNEAPRTGHAAAVGTVLGKIHAASARPEFQSAGFQNQDDFLAIRIEPYLHFTAGKHRALAGQLHRLGESLHRTQAALVHGDVSPKNILFRGDLPVILDAECATMGDPAFDAAFCLNHLALKSLHLPQHRHDLINAMLEFWASYKRHIEWESTDELEARIAALLPALMLARVDGKSPVEYLSSQDQEKVRRLAAPLIQEAPVHLDGVLSRISTME